MGSKVCMNGLCGATTYSHGKKGWPLRSGGFAILCHNCWTLYEQLAFCDMFHSDDSGWRECISCGKRLHCGCVASSALLEILDSSGVICIRCAKGSGVQGVQPKGFESPTEFGTSMEKYVGETLSSSIDNQINGDSIHNMDFKQFANLADGNGPKQFLPRQDDNIVSSHCQMTQEGSIPPSADTGNTCFSNFGQLSAGSSHNAKTKVSEDKENSDFKDVYGSPVQTNLTISLATPSLIHHSSPTAVCEVIKSVRTVSSFQSGSRSHHLLPKASQPDVTEKLDHNASTVSPIRVARPPVEGRIKNQLLPRYWPRITEQELQKISGDSNSTIIPLFEKILSASDAGRIGRLVLPKACAEAYFPPISQPEGIPVRIQDVKGEEWVFQFRFWPNNNSRMYVLEGVTPCIQSMQLQAGDTVTFSRMDPEGKLLMGFRKASNNLMQNTHFSGKHNGSFASEPFLSGVIENLPAMSGYSGLLQSMSGGTDPHLKVFSKNLSSSSGDVSWHVTDEPGGKRMIDSLQVPERKRRRNIGLKSKRLVIDNQDALELKLTWEEVQEMLHPPASVQPTSVTVEDHEFEEYEAPPVLGKRSIFTARSSGKQEQWTTCDDCSKWRRLPADFLLPPVWRCQENVWDRSRCSCTAPDELSPWELEQLFKLNNDFKRRRITVFNLMSTHNHDSNSRGVLASSTVQGDVNVLGAPEVAITTKHPRHRPGCSCIVCIQPPSGKGKHKPTCTCNVCTTVKRRFKTLMLRKKKRQTDREAEIAQRNQFIWGPKEEVEVDSTSQGGRLVDLSENRSRSGSDPHANDQRNDQADRVINANADKLDLNCQPNSSENFPIKSTRISMMSLVQVATRPLEIYLKQNGLASLISEQQTSSVSHALPQATTESEGQPRQDQSLALVAQEEEPESDDKLSEPIQIGTDLS